jgi:hypothetical protein
MNGLFILLQQKSRQYVYITIERKNRQDVGSLVYYQALAALFDRITPLQVSLRPAQTPSKNARTTASVPSMLVTPTTGTTGTTVTFVNANKRDSRTRVGVGSFATPDTWIRAYWAFSRTRL